MINVLLEVFYVVGGERMPLVRAIMAFLDEPLVRIVAMLNRRTPPRTPRDRVSEQLPLFSALICELPLDELATELRASTDPEHTYIDQLARIGAARTLVNRGLNFSQENPPAGWLARIKRGVTKARGNIYPEVMQAAIGVLACVRARVEPHRAIPRGLLPKALACFFGGNPNTYISFVNYHCGKRARPDDEDAPPLAKARRIEETAAEEEEKEVIPDIPMLFVDQNQLEDDNTWNNFFNVDELFTFS
jgi:hypothetical protein